MIWYKEIIKRIKDHSGRDHASLYVLVMSRTRFRVNPHSIAASLAKWLSVRLRTKWFWVRVQLQSLHHASHMVKHNTETSHTDVNTANFKITDMDFSNNKRKQKIAECLRIKDLRPRLNVQEKSIPLKLLN